VTAIVVVSVAPANAGLFTFISSVFSDLTGAPLASKILNSQNLALLRAATNIDPNPAKGGGGVNIVGNMALMPDSGPLGTIADVESFIPKSDQISVYIVRPGDSLSQIAELFDVSASTIIWTNDIKRGDLIHEGQTLVILPISGVRHTVKKGDTLGSIAKKYKGLAGEIIEYNELDPDASLAIGQTLIVPNGKIKIPVYSSSGKVVRGTSVPTYSGYYLRPVKGGRRSQGLHGYNAVDLAVSNGTTVVAAASGKIILSRTGWNGGYGNYIVIAHNNGTQTVYAHNSRNIVYSGQRVNQGQVIAYSGSTGRSTGPHVHFEVRGAKNPF